jgi:hypothetical protein
MPLNEIPKYISSETRSLIDSALEQAWQELKRDGPADIDLARRKLAGTIVALASVGETDPAKLKRFALHAARGMADSALGDLKGRRVCNTVR